jgi:protein-disulfide isomerase
MQRFAILILLLATLAGAQQKSPVKPAANPSTKLPSEETVIAFFHAMFGYDPSVSFKVIDIRPSAAAGLAQVNFIMSKEQGQQASTIYVTEDGQHAIAGDLMNFGAKPFQAQSEILKRSANGPSRGAPNADLLIVEFSDLQCPHCKKAQPVIEQLLKDEPNAHFVYQNFPLPSHDWAMKAAEYADCVGAASNEALWKFIDGTYDAQESITAANADEKLTAVADQSGVKGADIAACAKKPETASHVEDSIALGKSVDVNATPSVFINGRKIESLAGIPPEVLKKLVEFQAKEAK